MVVFIGRSHLSAMAVVKWQAALSRVYGLLSISGYQFCVL
ncbi:hypothetical protein GP5015_1171 [gamma proteobacterium HTCC5015]|nr:hypothetical protein GP5015_1171 [gamma proteobacterium HTCC5015]